MRMDVSQSAPRRGPGRPSCAYCFVDFISLLFAQLAERIGFFLHVLSSA